ncbi:MAG: protein kinase [Pyrinomonadaceae bacterium]|nr:protein kinase [Pyrinomonadaceae bacterium]
MKKCPKCGTEYPDTNTLCPSDGIALEKTDDSLLGKTLAGKYRIEVRLNEGGMGTVYRGTHVLMDKTVAVKVLRPSLAADEKIVARFSREARAASRISHPHALSVTDFGEAEDGVVFLVMEYLDGKTLKEIIREDGPMALPRAVEILRQVGGALDAAHNEGVVHRDLKSDNIMLLSSSGTDYAKVLDFGIAKIKEADGAYDPGLTAPDLVIGTPQYMSPEQCSQSPDIDARSDIYSLGVILYELLVGHVPFTGESPTAIMLKHLQEPAPSVLDERSDVPPAVAAVVARALAKGPEDRYQTVNELVEDFTIAAGMTPVTDSSSASHKRLVVPVESVSAEFDGADEETLVRRRLTTPMTPPPMLAETPPPASSFTPWKILLPSAIGLLLIFGVIYAFTRNSQSPTEGQPGSALTADPNSQPVEAASPATGQSEAGIPVGGVTNPDGNPNVNADASPSPSPANQAPGILIEPEPSPTPNDNTNTRKNPAVPTPVPTRTVVDEPPPPSPAATKPPAPKPTVTTPGAAPGEQ